LSAQPLNLARVGLAPQDLKKSKTTIYLDEPCACRKSNPNILVVQPAQDRAAKNGPGQFDGARDRRIQKSSSSQYIAPIVI
jgi:hypothetical protein